MDTLKDIEKLKQAIEKKAGRTMRSPVDFDRLSYLIHENIREQISPSTLKRLWGYLLSHAPVFVSIHLGSLHRLPRLGCILPIITHDNRILLFYKRNDPFCKSATGKKIENSMEPGSPMYDRISREFNILCHRIF